MEDTRDLFNRLVKLRQSEDSRISNTTYSLIPYFCVDEIGNFGWYPKADSAVYVDKYKAITTQFSETETVSADSNWGFPFRLLVFILQLNICIAVFFALYRLLLYNSTSFVVNRIYLLAGIVLSVVVALRLITIDVLIPIHVIELGEHLKLVGWVVLGIYALSALHLLYILIKQIQHIYILRKDNWRIDDGNYYLCILKDIITQPITFFRTIFISWDNFLAAVNARSATSCWRTSSIT
ncbi:MAG: hypothetical protein LBG19_05735 [Prevotellaceae bacterium]|jgi:hypothetical protein|nr:hypothetical protein [Prevotellaceae bacterium]